MKFLKRSVLTAIAFCFLLGCRVNAASQPTITATRLINEQDIEIYWSEDVQNADEESNFSVKVDGVENPIYSYTWEEYNYTEKGIVYYNNKTSIRMTNPISDVSDLPDIEITIAGNKIKNRQGNYVEAQTVKVTEYRSFYQKEIELDCGVRILGAESVSDEAVNKAKEMLEVLLSNEEIADRMGNFGCMLGIYGKDNIAYDIPEHRYSYDEAYLYVEGFGGTQLASIKDANVLRLKTGDYQTGYPDESILVHEFGHTIKNYGLTEKQQAELTKIYQDSVQMGKWENTYAGSNEDEFFATLSAIWFNVMDDTYDGQTDGVRGPINTRAELKLYDESAYQFMQKIYPSDIFLPAPWENGSGVNNYDYMNANAKVDETDKDTEVPSVKPIVQKPSVTDIKPKATSLTLKAKKRTVTVTVKKVAGVSGYKITYAKDAKFKKSVKTREIRGSKLTLKKMKKGTYYFKVQSFVKDAAGNKIYSNASKAKKIKIKG